MADMPSHKPPTDASPSTLAERAPLAPPSRLRRGMTVVRRWARETFSREQLVSGLKQLAWVAPLTLLIWVYAERDQQIDRDVRFAVEVRTSNPKSSVRLSDPADGYVSATLRGPRARLEQLSNELGPRASAVRYEADPDLKEGDRQISLASIVKGDRRFDGVTIKGSQPPLVSVVVDSVDEVIVPVQVRDEDKSRFDQVSFNPPRVKVRMPKKAMERAASGGQLKVHADLALMANQSPGQKPEVPGIRVSVENADPDDVTIEPSTVSVSLVVREADKPFLINTLPIDNSGAGRVLNTVNVELENYSLFNVKVVGPAEAISEMERTGAANVKAYVTIDATDVEKGAQQKEIWFVLPPGVKVQSVNGEPVLPGKPITVEVTVESRGDGLSRP